MIITTVRLNCRLHHKDKWLQYTVHTAPPSGVDLLTPVGYSNYKLCRRWVGPCQTLFNLEFNLWSLGSSTREGLHGGGIYRSSPALDETYVSSNFSWLPPHDTSHNIMFLFRTFLRSSQNCFYWRAVSQCDFHWHVAGLTLTFTNFFKLDVSRSVCLLTFLSAHLCSALSSTQPYTTFRPSVKQYRATNMTAKDLNTTTWNVSLLYVIIIIIMMCCSLSHTTSALAFTSYFVLLLTPKPNRSLTESFFFFKLFVVK